MRSAINKATLVSFLVYLLPLIGPHTSQPFGVVLVRELTQAADQREPLWIAADLCLALVLQGSAGFLAYWFFRYPSWRRFVVLLSAAPLLWVALMWTYLQAIPRYFLVDSGRSPEIETWPEECRVQDAYLPVVKTPPDLSLERTGRAFIARLPNSDMGILQMPGCEVTELGVRWNNYSPRIHSVAAMGAVLYSLHDRTTDAWSWWVLEGPTSKPAPLTPPPHADYPEPILSSDGQWVAWVQRIPVEGRQMRPAVFVEPLYGGDPITIDLASLAPATFRLHHFDYEDDEIVVTRREEEFFSLGLDGAVRWGPWNPEHVKAWVGTRRHLQDGWVAWDAYRDEQEYQLAWSLPPREERHIIQRGYSIESAAVDPEGRYIAVSIGGRYTFSMPDSVYVLTTSNTREVFRRYLPQYNRSQVAFLGSEFFAYKDGNDIRVLRTNSDE